MRHRHTCRRGWTTLWLVIWLPVLMVLLCGLVAVANLWLARVELENALESAALAAVKEWGDADGDDTREARKVGALFAAANTVRGQRLDLETSGDFIFGEIDDSNPDHVVFIAGTTGHTAAKLAVRAQASVQVPLMGLPFLGATGPSCVQAKATAVYDCHSRRVRLVRVDEFAE
jgi:Flp pilus assembly protein TadG